MQKFDKIEDALEELKQGKVIIVCDDEKRENEGDFVALAEFVTPEMINFMITHGHGIVCVPMAQEHAHKLQLHPMVNKNTDNFNTAFTVSVDHISNSTGVSIYDRATTIQRLTADDAHAEEFRRPGHMFPLAARPLGVFERAGHTEAAVDLAILCKQKPVGILCEIINENGTMARYDDLARVRDKFKLKMIVISDLIQYRKQHNKLVQREVVASLPTTRGKFNIYGFSSILDNKEHVVLVKESETEELAQFPLVRLHSECLTGDVFHSMRCDCGEQLDGAMDAVEQSGYGAILYLRQEGRGIGLFNKLKAYQLQEDGLDTVEANEELGFAADLREYSIAAHILKDLGFHTVRLLSNNPAKKAGLEEYGINVVEMVALKSTPHAGNAEYLKVKQQKMGHVL